MTFDECISAILEAGWSLHYLRGPDPQGYWEAYVCDMYDDNHVRKVAHARRDSAVGALEGAIDLLESQPSTEQFIPTQMGEIREPNLLEKLGLMAKPKPIQRRI